MTSIFSRPQSRFIRQVALRFHEDRCLQLSSSLTFTTLLALVPLLTVMLTVASAFPAFSGVTGQIDDFIASHVLPEQIGKTVLRYIEQFSQRAGRLTLLGLSVLAATSFLTMLNIERAFNIIWQLKRRRPLVQRIVVYWAILTLAPVLIGASLTMTSYLVSASAGLSRAVPLLGVAVLWLVPFVLTIATFTLLYFIVPARTIEFRHALIGGVVAGVLFELAKRGFAVYVSKVPTYTMVYGTFATFPIFLLWIYLSWVVTVLGAVVTASLPDYGHLRASRATVQGLEFCEATEILIVLAKAHASGEVIDLARIAARAHLPRDHCERLLESLAAAGWAGHVDGGRWALICDSAAIRMSDVCRRFVLSPDSLAAVAAHPGLASVLTQLAAGLDTALAMSVRDLLDCPPKPVVA
jgi:membrane protein